MSDESAYEIEIINRHSTAIVDENLLRRSLCVTLRRFNIKAAQLSIAIVNDDEIAALHDRFMSDPTPTDVLTFDLRDEGPSHNHSTTVEGDIVVSADTAARMSTSRDHSLDAELTLYAVHGLLHLLGMDDHDEQDAQKMHATEDAILTEVGVGPVYKGAQDCT